MYKKEMKLFTCVAYLVAVAVAMPSNLVERDDGEQYYVVPVSREKRETTNVGNVGIHDSGFSIAHQGTILNNNNHRLDGSAVAAKNYASHGLRPDQLSGRLDYAHKSGVGAFVAADHARHFGTDLHAGLKYNIYQGRNFGVDVGGQYGRHFGGPFGPSKLDSALYMKMYGHY